MRLVFIQLASFVADWRDLNLDDDDLRALEGMLLEHPDAGAVMPRCGGLRKVRFAPPSAHSGKRGGTRVVYAWFPAFDRVYYFAIYGKNVQAKLTPAEETRYAALLKALERRLDKEPGS